MGSLEPPWPARSRTPSVSHSKGEEQCIFGMTLSPACSSPNCLDTSSQNPVSPIHPIPTKHQANYPPHADAHASLFRSPRLLGAEMERCGGPADCQPTKKLFDAPARPPMSNEFPALTDKGINVFQEYNLQVSGCATTHRTRLRSTDAFGIESTFIQDRKGQELEASSTAFSLRDSGSRASMGVYGYQEYHFPRSGCASTPHTHSKPALTQALSRIPFKDEDLAGWTRTSTKVIIKQDTDTHFAYHEHEFLSTKSGCALPSGGPSGLIESWLLVCVRGLCYGLMMFFAMLLQSLLAFEWNIPSTCTDARSSFGTLCCVLSSLSCGRAVGTGSCRSLSARLGRYYSVYSLWKTSFR